MASRPKKLAAPVHPMLLSLPSLRQPPWRWQLAKIIGGAPSLNVGPISTDKYCSDAAFYLHAKTRKGESDINLFTKYPDIYTAHSIYTHSAPMGIRWQLEAMLLTGATVDEIAAKIPGLTGKVVTTFSKLYFDVLDYLNNDVIVSSAVIAASQFGPPDDRHWDYLWKKYAISFGFEQLCQFMGPKATFKNESDINWMRGLHERNIVEQITLLTANLRRGHLQNINETLVYSTDIMRIPANTNQASDMMRLQKNLMDVSGCFGVTLIVPKLPEGTLEVVPVLKQ